MEKTLETQLLEFQKKISVIKKDSKNPHFKNTYASLTQILSEVKPVLNEVGILLMQPIMEGKVGTVLSYNGIEKHSFIDLPTNLQPQPLGSAITYFRRYTIASLLALEIDDDDAQSTNKPTVTVTEDKTPLPEQVETAKAKLINASSLEDLKTKWSTLTKLEQTFQDVIELKDKLKQTLK